MSQYHAVIIATFRVVTPTAHCSTISETNLPLLVDTHLAPQQGFDGYAGYEVRPDDVEQLED